MNVKQYMKRWRDKARDIVERIGGKPGDYAAERSEADYYPGIESLTRAPLPASSRWLISTVFLLFVFVLLWASCSTIEIVSPASGKAISSSRTRQIQAPQLSRVQEILVAEGETVKKGQPLIRLRDDSARSQWREARDNAGRLEAKKKRIQALLEAVKSGAGEAPRYPVDPSEGTLADRGEAAALRDQWASYAAEAASLEKSAERARATVGRIEAEIEQLEQLLPFSERKVERYRTLGSSVSREVLDEAREHLVERRSTLATLRQQHREAVAERDQAVQEVRVHTERFVSGLSLELAEVETRLSQALEAVKRNENLLSQYTLTAPFDGVVTAIEADTRGVVEPAEVLMRVVPENVPLEVEVNVLNKDAGFVEVGQQVKVKVDTFNFTKYGAIPGTITHLARDAVEDEQLGLVYPALIELEHDTVMVGAREARLAPGMTVAADIQVGSRRLIEYVLNPILRYRDEVMRER